MHDVKPRNLFTNLQAHVCTFFLKHPRIAHNETLGARQTQKYALCNFEDFQTPGMERTNENYSSRHQIACFKATEGLQTPPPPYSAALSHQYSVASFATLLVLSCLNSSGFRYSCCNVVRFCCDLETCNS
jgi:hypothetical protein